MYCTATVQLATFRTDLDLRQAKLGLCTTKDETELLTGCLNSVWLHSVVHVGRGVMFFRSEVLINSK